MFNFPEKDTEDCSESERRLFRATLGASFRTISELWNLLDPINLISNRAKPMHLLWLMVFLKVNKSEPIHLKITGCKSRDTFRQWVRRFANAVANLESKLIVFENRFKNWNGRTQCLISIDGTDVQINEPGDRSSLWWSHKYNGPGVRYEVGVCIRTAHIVWFRGPFPCNVSDKEIFDTFLAHKLIPGEAVEADSGYRGRSQIFLPGEAQTRKARKQKSQVRGRHENINARLKVFGVMQFWANPDTGKHGLFARCVAIIVQLSFTLDEKLYDVPYAANYD